MFQKGTKVKILSKPTGYESRTANVEVGDAGVVNYVDGCCLCVTTDKDTFTANTSRFELLPS